MPKIKIKERHVASRFVPGGYNAGTTYEVSDAEAKELVDRELATRANSAKDENVVKVEETSGGRKS